MGTQTHIEIAHETTPANVRALAKALAELDVTLNITELDIGFPKGSAGNLGAADYAKQGHIYRQFMDVFLEEPNMGEFVMWGLTDAHSWLDEQQGKTEGLIYDKQYKSKPAFDSIMASLKAHPASEVKTPYPPEVFNPPDSTKDSTDKPGEIECDSEPCGDSTITIKPFAMPHNISMHIVGRTLFVTGAIGMATSIDVFDLQGRPIFSTKSANGSVDLAAIAEGSYVVRAQDGTTSFIRKIAIK